jgi:hypothetical protein
MVNRTMLVKKTPLATQVANTISETEETPPPYPESTDKCYPLMGFLPPGCTEEDEQPLPPHLVHDPPCKTGFILQGGKCYDRHMWHDFSEDKPECNVENVVCNFRDEVFKICGYNKQDEACYHREFNVLCEPFSKLHECELEIEEEEEDKAPPKKGKREVVELFGYIQDLSEGERICKEELRKLWERFYKCEVDIKDISIERDCDIEKDKKDKHIKQKVKTYEKVPQQHYDSIKVILDNDTIILNGTMVNATVIPDRNIIIMTTSNEELDKMFKLDTQLKDIASSNNNAMADLWRGSSRRSMAQK